jgi:hypothetical protein
VALEAAMKARTGTDSFGWQLVKDFFDALYGEGRWLTSALRTDKTEITAAFQFVRNEFSHNTIALTSLRLSLGASTRLPDGTRPGDREPLHRNGPR